MPDLGCGLRAEPSSMDLGCSSECWADVVLHFGAIGVADRIMSS